MGIIPRGMLTKLSGSCAVVSRFIYVYCSQDHNYTFLGNCPPTPPFSQHFEIRKKICKTVLVNSGIFSGKNECACETVVLEDSFANLFSDFPQKRTVGKSKDRFLGVKNCFWIPRFIGNPKSVFKNLNPDFSMESTSLKFWFFRILVA